MTKDQEKLIHDLVSRLEEIHKAAGGEWDEWMNSRSPYWYDETEKLLKLYKDPA